MSYFNFSKKRGHPVPTFPDFSSLLSGISVNGMGLRSGGI